MNRDGSNLQFRNPYIKKMFELNGTDKILYIIKNSKKVSKSILFLPHYINIRTKKSVDLVKDKQLKKKIVNINKK